MFRTEKTTFLIEKSFSFYCKTFQLKTSGLLFNGSRMVSTEFDYMTTIFNGFRMASTTGSTSGLVDYDFKKFPRCARLV